ncbi:unnamed protein product, partial [Laminaria digitata]
MPAVVFDLFPVVFLIGEAAPASVPVPNPYRPVLRPAGGTPPATAIGRTAAQGATVGTKRGRPKGGKNKDGAKKPGRNARTASAEEAVKNTAICGHRVPAHHRREPARHLAAHHRRLP